jgi:hypothetical protein
MYINNHGIAQKLGAVWLTVSPVDVTTGSSFSPRCLALNPGVPRVRVLENRFALRRVERAVVR